ncbi:MAG: Grx4 family monothiol glutaredoxin [Bdellovibrionales bacterium]|nr:Grx4 family monothiol glutaredoxin [Bdellovibrionales bacterium]
MNDVKNQIETILTSNDVVLFMKGTPSFPQCGFSARAVAILNECNAKFHAIDVLADQVIREGIKAYGNWPTIPQLYIKKELIGGSDIMMEMYEAGELQKALPKA